MINQISIQLTKLGEATPPPSFVGPPKKGTFGVPGTTISKGDEYRTGNFLREFQMSHGTKGESFTTVEAGARSRSTGPQYRNLRKRWREGILRREEIDGKKNSERAIKRSTDGQTTKNVETRIDRSSAP